MPLNRVAVATYIGPLKIVIRDSVTANLTTFFVVLITTTVICALKAYFANNVVLARTINSYRVIYVLYKYLKQAGSTIILC